MVANRAVLTVGGSIETCGIGECPTGFVSHCIDAESQRSYRARLIQDGEWCQVNTPARRPAGTIPSPRPRSGHRRSRLGAARRPCLGERPICRANSRTATARPGRIGTAVATSSPALSGGSCGVGIRSVTGSAGVPMRIRSMHNTNRPRRSRQSPCCGVSGVCVCGFDDAVRHGELRKGSGRRALVDPSVARSRMDQPTRRGEGTGQFRRRSGCGETPVGPEHGAAQSPLGSSTSAGSVSSNHARIVNQTGISV